MKMFVEVFQYTTDDKVLLDDSRSCLKEESSFDPSEKVLT